MTTAHAVTTPRFGRVEFLDDDLVTFDEGLVGLPEYRRFLLIAHKAGSPFRWLQCLDGEMPSFLVVDPQVYVGDYAPGVPVATADSLGIDEETPVLVYTVCTVPSGNPRGMTLNLAGPIVVNAATRQGRQIVLEDEVYPVRHPVFGDAQATAA